MSNWVKTTPYGDYKKTPDRTSAQVHVIRKARALRIAGKHAGSKPLSRLIQGIRSTEVTSAILLKWDEQARERIIAKHEAEEKLKDEAVS